MEFFRRKEEGEATLDDLAGVLVPKDTNRSRAKRLLTWSLPTVAAAVAAALIGVTVYLGASPAMLPTIGKSMQPTLYQGDLAFLEGVAAEDLAVGDAIAFRTTEQQQVSYGVPSVVLHRITEINEGRQGLVFTTQGDNNAEVDPYRVPEINVIGKMVGSVPKAGLPFLIFVGPYGKFLIVGGLSLLGLYFALGFVERAQARTRARDELMLRLARALESGGDAVR